MESCLQKILILRVGAIDRLRRRSLDAGKGAEGGVDATASGSLGGAGKEITVNYPIYKDGQRMNPVSQVTTSTSTTIGGESHGVGGEIGDSSANPSELKASFTFGEGLVGSVEVANEGVGELLSTIGNSIRQDINDAIETVKSSLDQTKISKKPG